MSVIALFRDARSIGRREPLPPAFAQIAVRASHLAMIGALARRVGALLLMLAAIGMVVAVKLAAHWPHAPAL